ncbi:MAG: hypothetical protein U5J63_16880 [Fodinibius sp.]|nr:hypothetical protein [Fodinibius sp.]
MGTTAIPPNIWPDRKNLSKGSAPVNLIHQDDCIGIIDMVISKDVRGNIFNGVSDGHPPRKMYYPAAAKARDIEPPTFADDKTKNYKVVSNRKVKQVLGYDFRHPNPMDT